MLKKSFHISTQGTNTTVRIGKECENMKKTRFWLVVCLLVTMFTMTGCGNQTDTNNDAIPDDQQNQTMEQNADDTDSDIRDDADDAADDVRDDADSLGDDIKDGVDDAADDVKDALDGDDKSNNNNHTDKNQNDVKQ